MTPRYSAVHSFLYQRQQSSPLTGVHNRHIPRHYLVTTQMTHSDSCIHDTRSTELFSLSQCTNPTVFLTTQANPPIQLSSPPPQSTHVFSYNATAQSVFYSFTTITQCIVFHYYKSHLNNHTYSMNTSNYTKNLSLFI